MKELLDKISSYNLFNYLLPGIIFAALAQDMIRFPVLQRDVFSAVFLCYFVGLAISRFGAVILEPLLKWLRFVRFADYRDFVHAAKKDDQVALLSEVNNTYRTLCALFILLLLLKLCTKIEGSFPSLRDWNGTALAIVLLVLFLFSYRKQTAYVTKRIDANKHAEPTRSTNAVAGEK
jgi:hypothetical protein